MRPPRPCVVIGAFLLAGCSATEPVQETTPPLATPPSSASPSATPQSVEFITQIDTVDAVRAEALAGTDSTLAPGEERFAIQIGAFKEPHNASIAQNLARERYHLSVLNEFHPRLALYQIRIGSFASREAARSHLLRMQAEHPDDYRDSWIVQVMR